MVENNNSALMTIGSVSRATGIPTNTIRTWERRYGFPQPERTDSGQRVYRTDVVAHLKLVGEALESGHRPRQVLAMALEDLQALLGSATIPTEVGPDEVPELWKRAVHELDGPQLGSSMRQEAARLGALRFTIERVAPFLNWCGLAWHDGRIEIHQEHFASDHVRSVLDESWRSLAPVVRPTVVCATLPGEDHDLGVYMAAVAVSAGGRRPLVLPGSTPVAQIVSSVRSTRARAVAVSLSINSAGPEFADMMRELRATLPDDVVLWCGGKGAPMGLAGVEVGDDLRRLTTLS